MPLVPYGYRFRHGDVVIDEEAAGRVRALFASFLSGISYLKAAKSAGIETSHSQIKRMIQNPVYMGNEEFPVIVEANVFEDAQKEISKRLSSRCPHKARSVGPAKKIGVSFSFCMPKKLPNDPWKRAILVYSAIKEDRYGDNGK